MSSSWWMLIRSRLPEPVGGFIFIPVRKVHQKISLAAVMQRKTTRFRVCTNDRKRFIIKEKRLWNSAYRAKGVVAVGKDIRNGEFGQA